MAELYLVVSHRKPAQAFLWHWAEGILVTQRTSPPALGRPKAPSVWMRRKTPSSRQFLSLAASCTDCCCRPRSFWCVLRACEQQRDCGAAPVDPVAVGHRRRRFLEPDSFPIVPSLTNLSQQETATKSSSSARLEAQRLRRAAVYLLGADWRNNRHI